MLDALNTALSWLGDLLSGAFLTLVNFLLGFFPDADPSINAVIDSWNVGGGGLTMNPLYFLDVPMVMVCAGMAVTVIFVCLLVSFVRWVISTVHELLDSIPVIG